MADLKWICTHSVSLGAHRYRKGQVVLAPSNPNASFFAAYAADDMAHANNWLIDRDGTVYAPGPTWDDLSFPASGINPVGAASDPTVDTTLTTFTGTYLFAGNAENIIAGVFQMPHARKVGSVIRPHIHWSLPVGAAASEVTWEFYYRISAPGKTASAWSDAIAGTLEVDGGTTADSENITTFGSIEVPAAYDVPSVNVSWKLHRLGNTDSNNGNARLLFVDFHVLRDSLGSGQEYIK